MLVIKDSIPFHEKLQTCWCHQKKQRVKIITVDNLRLFLCMICFPSLIKAHPSLFNRYKDGFISNDYMSLITPHFSYQQSIDPFMPSDYLYKMYKRWNFAIVIVQLIKDTINVNSMQDTHQKLMV